MAACRRVGAEQVRDAAAAARFRIACGNVEVQAFLYGQSNRVGGDFLDSPEAFLSAAGAALVASKRNYLKLALSNSAHFQPLATREWRVLHARAVRRALAASRAPGAEQIREFEEAFFDSAVADHMLQDSFAAGHMGFNRAGSSAGASKAFHDQWNERGRWVTNRRGAVWKTYGDGGLDRSAAARSHVVVATAHSIYAVLAAFVSGRRNDEAELAVWEEVAFTIEDPEIVVNMEELFTGEEERSANGAPGRRDFAPLLAVMRPAVKDVIVAGWSVVSTTFEDGGTDGAFLVGGHLAFPWVGRLKAGAGLGFQGDTGAPRLAVDVGVVNNLMLSVDGLLSHDLDFGALALVGSGLDVTLRLAYQLNVEAGNWLVRFELGPSLSVNDQEVGLYGGVGLGWIVSAAGGGAFR